MRDIAPKTIEDYSYTDFVGFINQWNTPPGSYTTISKWIQFGEITDSSHVLELACTTGLSSREISKRTQCRAFGFDISEKSVQAARSNREKYAPSRNLTYKVGDGYNITFDQSFSHIVVGAALGFFPEPNKMLQRTFRWLKDEGKILASPFYIREPIPNSVQKEFKEVFDITPTTESYHDIMKRYRGLEILYQDRNIPVKESREEINHYSKSITKRVIDEKNLSTEIGNVIYNRLKEIKEMSNKLREYQGYTVLVLRKRDAIYPHRYVEKF